MNRRTTATLIVTLTVMAVLMGSCGGAEEAAPTQAPPTPTAATAARPTATAAPASPTAISRPPGAVTSSPTPQATPTPQPRQPTPTRSAAATGKLTLAVASFGNELLRPSLGTSGGTPVFGAPIYDWLTWNNRDGDPTPGIMSKWEMSVDARSWTVSIREGFRFHNGDRLAAEDVKFSLEQLVSDAATEANASANAKSWQAAIASVDTLSPLSVRINLKRPWPLFPEDASPRSGSEGIIISKAYVQSIGGIKAFDSKPIGTGPWKLVGHDIGVRFKYEAVATAHPIRETPKFKELELLLAPEESTRVAMLKTGAADLAELGSIDSVTDFRKREREGMQVFGIPHLVIPSVVIYGADDPRIQGMATGKREVREAMDYAVNRQELADTVFGGLAPVAVRYGVSPGTIGYDPSWKPWPYDMAKAKQLLAQAGYDRGFDLKVYSFAAPGVPYLARVTEIVASYWSQLGINVSIIPTDFAGIASRYRARPQQALEIVGQASSLWTTARPNAMGLFRAAYHKNGVSLLLTRPQTTELVEKMEAELDAVKRDQLIRQLVEIALNEHVTFPTASVPAFFGVGPRVGAWKPITSAGVGTALETVTPK